MLERRTALAPVLAIALLALTTAAGCTFDATALEDRECQGPTNRCPSGFACVAGYCLEQDEPDVPLDMGRDVPPDEPEVDVDTDPFAGCIDDDEDGFFRNELGCPVTAEDSDCDDDEESIFPGAPEDCNNIDDDCDGTVDNNLTPPLCEEQRGACEGATQQCRGGGWQPCDNAAPFQANNPAYLPDEAYCARGVNADKGWCNGGVSNFADVQAADDALCDLIDNDCDGSVDEESDIPCFQEDQGTDVNNNDTLVAAANYCRAGVRRCVDGQYMGGCADQITPVQETTPELRCDADDNDCNGIVLEACTCDVERDDPIVDDCICEPNSVLSCYPFDDGVAGRGECRAGTHTCGNDERYGPCVDAIGPVGESCANLGADDNCDGTPDNINDTAYDQPCDLTDMEYNGEPVFGQCTAGRMRCDVAGDGGVFACHPNILPGSQIELCGDRNTDNDCDGDTTDITVENVGDVHVGDGCDVPEAVGICLPGTWQCRDGGPVCEANEMAQGVDNICNGADDDCDGEIDDDVDFRLAPNCGECNENCDAEDTICCPDDIGSDMGECVVMRDNPAHCGGCGTVSEANLCNVDDNELCCGLACADTLTDNDHCGGCNMPCAEGLDCCGGSCVDLEEDELHCGQCGNQCDETLVCCTDSGTEPDFPGCYPIIQCDPPD